MRQDGKRRKKKTNRPQGEHKKNTKGQSDKRKGGYEPQIEEERKRGRGKEQREGKKRKKEKKKKRTRVRRPTSKKHTLRSPTVNGGTSVGSTGALTPMTAVKMNEMRRQGKKTHTGDAEGAKG